jgi:AP-4 complex subunit mu-1
MISNFFVISPRGDTIIAKQYRNERQGDVEAHERAHTEAFFRKIKFWSEEKANDEDLPEKDAETKRKVDAPPVFVMPDGLSYFHVKRNGMIFGCSSARNVSPTCVIEVCLWIIYSDLRPYPWNREIAGYFAISNTSGSTFHFVIQLLSTIAKVFKDYCGTLSEEAIRKNFILLYELLDEMLDYGYAQVTQTENLKAFIYNEPIVVEHVTNTGSMVNPKTASANAVQKPVISSVNVNGRKTSLSTNQKNEIFVDILERLNIVFSSNGYVLNSTIDGCIQMKSYLAGNPELRLALNEDLVVGRNNGYGSVVVDDINFNNCVNLTEFETARTLSFIPPDGEFVVLNYRMTGEFKVPFRIFPAIEEIDSKKLEITVLIRADIPGNHFGANVTVEIPVPRCTVAATCSVTTAPGAGLTSAEFVQKDGKIFWTMKKFPGASEMTMKAKVVLSQPCTTQIRREIGPINMNFEIPMYNVSTLQVKYLRIAENMPGYTPYRWVRYVTQSSSYVCRLS